jgi:hypothetical protein
MRHNERLGWKSNQSKQLPKRGASSPGSNKNYPQSGFKNPHTRILSATNRRLWGASLGQTNTPRKNVRVCHYFPHDLERVPVLDWRRDEAALFCGGCKVVWAQPRGACRCISDQSGLMDHRYLGIIPTRVFQKAGSARDAPHIITGRVYPFCFEENPCRHVVYLSQVPEI